MGTQPPAPRACDSNRDGCGGAVGAAGSALVPTVPRSHLHSPRDPRSRSRSPSLLLMGRRDVDGDRTHRQPPPTTTQRVQPSPWPAAAPPHPNTRSSTDSVTTDDSRHGKRSRQQPDRDGGSEPPPATPQGPAAPQRRGTRRCHRRAPTEITSAPRLSPAVNPLCLANRGSAALRGSGCPAHPGSIPAGRGAAAAAEPPAHPGEAAPTDRKSVV